MFLVHTMAYTTCATVFGYAINLVYYCLILVFVLIYWRCDFERSLKLHEMSSIWSFTSFAHLHHTLQMHNHMHPPILSMSWHPAHRTKPRLLPGTSPIKGIGHKLDWGTTSSSGRTGTTTPAARITTMTRANSGSGRNNSKQWEMRQQQWQHAGEGKVAARVQQWHVSTSGSGIGGGAHAHWSPLLPLFFFFLFIF